MALITLLENVRWEASEAAPAPNEGALLPSGRFRMRSGKAMLTFLNGVTLTVEGPADVDLVSTDKVFCRRGKLRARIPKGAEGFAVTSPGSAVVDLGTEFGLNVEPDGKSRVLVFEGTAETALLDASGFLERTQVVEPNVAFEIDPRSGRISESAASPEDFVTAPNPDIPPLRLDPAYPGAVVKSRPQSYWRFERESERTVPNEISGSPDLRINGPIRILGASQGNGFALFKPGAPEQYLDTSGLWKVSREPGHAVELWFLAENVSYGTLFGFYPTEAALPKNGDRKYAHVVMLGLTAEGEQRLEKPASVRLLHRWPTEPAMRPKGASNDPYSILMELTTTQQSHNQPSRAAFVRPHGVDSRVGVSVFSRNPYVPKRWYHLVAQREGDRIDLYVNGVLDHSLTFDNDRSTLFCQMVIGCRTADPLDAADPHPFVGRLDELAYYDHSLSPEEIRQHFALSMSH